MNKTTLLKLSQTWLRQLCASMVVTFLFALLASNAHATLQAYEPFNYTGTFVNPPSGTPTQTAGGGYTGGWTVGGGATYSIVSGLSYPGLLSANGALSVNQPNGGNYIQDTLASGLLTGTYYISYLFKPGTSVNGGSNSPTATFCDTGIQVAPGGIGFFLGVEAYGATAGNFTVMKTTQVPNNYNDNGTVAYQSAVADITYGTTNLIVLKLVSTSANNWNGTIWVNPTAGTSSEPAASGTFTGLVCNGAIQNMAYINRAGGNTLTFDEVRVATTWADAVSYITVAPTAPTSLTVASTGNNTVSLSWVAPGGGDTPVSYYVKRSTTSGSGYVNIATNAYPTATYTDAVAGGVTYYYVVSAVNAGGASPDSSEASAAPTLGAPSAPTSLAAVAGDSQVALSWAASVAATGYNVKRSTTTGAETTIASVSGTTYTDATAVNGTAYFYEVSATNSVGEGANSSEVSATPVAYIPVYEPFNYTLGSFSSPSSTGTGETGNWTGSGTIVAGMTYTGLPVGSNALSSGSGRQFVSFASSLSRTGGTKWISFLYKASGNMGGNIDGVYFPNGGTGLWFGFGLAPNSGTQGGLGLASINTVGTGATGASSLASSFLGTYGTTYLVVLEIQYNTGGGNDTVTVFLQPTGNAAAPGVSATYNYTAFNVGTITGIGLNVQGGATVTVDEIRTGATYGSVVGYNPPSVPTGLSATPAVNSVGLNWTAVGAATGYKVLRGTSPGGETLLTSVGAASYTDNTAVGGTTYYYTVQATNASGASASSSEVSATPTIALPNVPAGLTATGTNGAVRLSWFVATGAGGYNVKRSTSTGTEVTIANVGTTSYSDAGVVNGTQYFYVVSSTNTAGESANSSEVSATPNVPPAAPTGLSATAGTGQVSLSWTGSSGAVSYNVYRSTTSGSGYNVIGTTTAPTVAYLDAKAIKFTQYYYVVSAVNSYGEGSFSSEVTATPAGVYGPTAYESFNYATGPLTNNTPSTATGFTGNWSIPTGVPNIVAGLAYPGLPVGNNACQQTPTGSQNTVSLASSLSSGTAYVSFLFAGAGNPGATSVGVLLQGNNANSLFCGFEGGYSTTQTSFGLGTVTSTSQSGATPLGATTPVNNTGVHLAVIRIDFNTSGANDTVSLWIDPPAGVTTPGVAANTMVTSVDVGTISGFGINVQGAYGISFDEIRFGQVYGDVVGYIPPPAAPAGLTATPGVNTVGLAWNAVSGATGYNVLRGTSTGVYTVTNAAASNAYTDNTAVGGTQYFYVVAATNSTGAGPNSSEVSATPSIAVPAVPAGLTATGGNGVVNLSWSAATGAASYNVKRSTATGTESFLISVGTTSYADTAVVNGQQYFYVVSSTNTAGESADSSEASATPNVPPAAPTGLSATAGNNQVSLSWAGSAGAVSYNVYRSTTSGSGYSVIGTTIDPTVAYLDTTAVKFTQYYYVVSAVNSYGEGGNSSEVSATPTGTYGPSAYESFNYPAGAFANNTPSTAAGFTGDWTIPTGANITTGLSYAGLPVSNNAYQHVATGSQNTVSLASPLSSGTAYISFLIQDSGNSGGDSVGVLLKGSNANSLFCGFEGGYSSSQTSFGLGSVSSTSLGAAATLGSTTPIDNTTVHLVVLRIDFNTSGANDTVSLWIDPPAGTTTPGVAANTVVSTFDVGTISAFGINILGGYSAQIDEVRIGQLYGDVVGYVPPPAAPTGLSAVAGLNQVTLSWTGSAGATSYNVKRSTTSGAEVTIGTTIDPTVTYNDSTAVPGTLYYYVVSAVNGGGESANRSEVSATSINGASTNLVTSVAGNQLTLSWPADHTGWTLQTQTNTLTGTWYDVAGSATTNQVIITIDPTLPPVFYRMKY